MNLLEILLLIFITYGLLAAGRKKTKKAAGTDGPATRSGPGGGVA